MKPRVLAEARNHKIVRWLRLIASLFWLLAMMPGVPIEAGAAGGRLDTMPVADFKLAILTPLTGPVQTLGRSARDGALLAVEQQNAGGGILGMTVAPVVEDTACDATTAVAATNKVIQDGVHYIIGDVCSRSSIPMSEIVNAASVIMMTPTATHPQVTTRADGVVKEYVFRAAFIDPFQGGAAARFARDTLLVDKAFILLNQDNPYSQGLADAFEAEFAKSGMVVGKEVYANDETDFSAILDRVSAAQPDVVYLPDYYNIVNLVTQQAKAKGIVAPFIGGDDWDSNDLDAAAASGSYFTTHLSFEDPRPEVSAFNQAFRARYGYAPDTIAALAYDAAKLIFQAIQEANSGDTAMVKTKLAAIAFQGVTGALSYDASHNPIKSVVVMDVQADGAHFFVLIPPPTSKPRLTINYSDGSPGSYFTFMGAHFPPRRAGTISINGHTMAQQISVDAVGGVVFRLDTTGADEGRYFVTVSVNPSATASFMLDRSYPQRPPEGSGAVVVVPPGIAYTEFVHLPSVWR